MTGLGLGCAKTSALAPQVEISLSNCISESQIILQTRGSMPCWRIVFSKVAVARKLAVILHRMWIEGTEFNWSSKEATNQPA
jgi:hypothetical protein